MPKLAFRQLMSSITVSWKQPSTNGSSINAYFLQIAKVVFKLKKSHILDLYLE